MQRVSSTVNEISEAGIGQSDDIAQVNQAVDNLDHMTQQNAALVEQTAAELIELVAVFKIARA